MRLLCIANTYDLSHSQSGGGIVFGCGSPFHVKLATSRGDACFPVGVTMAT